MGVQITIRDVPKAVRDELASRAAREGKSMQEFLRHAMENLGEKVPIRAARNRSQDGEKRRTALTYGSVDSDHGNRT